jgi:hypothetical protein
MAGGLAECLRFFNGVNATLHGEDFLTRHCTLFLKNSRRTQGTLPELQPAAMDETSFRAPGAGLGTLPMGCNAVGENLRMSYYQ